MFLLYPNMNIRDYLVISRRENDLDQWLKLYENVLDVELLIWAFVNDVALGNVLNKNYV